MREMNLFNFTYAIIGVLIGMAVEPLCYGSDIK